LSELCPLKPTFTEADLPTSNSKTYLITGGAAGIGKELTRILYSANATVYIAGRDLTNIENVTKDIIENPSSEIKENPASGKIGPLILDLSDLSTIKPAIQHLEKETSTLDAIFLNAGVSGPPKDVKTVQGHEMTWGTNVIGHFLLKRLLLPFLVKSAKVTGSARILWVASDASNLSPAPDGIYWDDIDGSKADISGFNLYAQSKAGNIILATETARRYGAENIVSVSLNPGHLKTGIARHLNPWFVMLASAIIAYDARFGAFNRAIWGIFCRHC
jgi:retinol dehydrogenase-12